MPEITLDHIRAACQWARNAAAADAPQPIGEAGDGLTRAYDQAHWECGTSCCVWGAASILSGNGPAIEGPPAAWAAQSAGHLLAAALMRSGNSTPDRIENATYLKGANLEGADLKGANLEGADLKGADLKGANLEGADLKGANLEGANLEGADLKGANLEGADLKGANLEGADLEGADLKGADLKGADLEGAWVLLGVRAFQIRG
jgi:hypothetical protein